MAANEGRYSEAEQHPSSEALSAWRSDLGVMAGGLKVFWGEMTKNGNIERLEIIREEVRGEGATVSFRIHFKDGTTKEDEAPLIREDGRWKITIG